MNFYVNLKYFVFIFSGLYSTVEMAYHGLSQHVKFEELPAPGDRFVLQDLIGEGTYGEVHSARDTVTGKALSHTLLST
jgi:myosin-3